MADLTVYGPRGSLPRCDVALAEGDRVTLPELDLNPGADVPGHTAGHIAYTGRAAGIEPVLPCGDTLLPGLWSTFRGDSRANA